MRTVLALYLNKVLLYSEDDATVLYHGFTFLCYFFPLVGGIIADSFLGKFKTIFYLSLVYALGNIVLSTASATVLNLPTRAMSILGLVLIAIGTGGIKPCVSAFGGDQFVLPQQERQLQQFFSIFYFSINAGSVISTFITPIFREDVQCLGMKTCYPLAFGVPALLMVASLCIFVAGKPFYTTKDPEGNIIVHVFKCVSYALRNKFCGKASGSKDHWLDHADDKFEAKLIGDIKALFKILYLLLPLPFFWALFDQQGSRWTFQATLMDGTVTPWWTIKPDQMQILNPMLILIFIPLFETVVYPVLQNVGIKRPLQKIGLGGFLTAVAFLISAIVEYKLEPSYPIMPTDTTGHLRVLNSYDCEMIMEPPILGNSKIDPYSALELINVPVNNTAQISTTIRFNYDSLQCNIKKDSYGPWKGNLILQQHQSVTYIFQSIVPQTLTLQRLKQYDDLEKSENGKPKLTLLNSGALSGKVSLMNENTGSFSFELSSKQLSTDTSEVDPGKYLVTVNGLTVQPPIEVKSGGVYYLLIQKDGEKVSTQINTLTRPATLHMAWLLPQIIIITASEILFSITGLEFSYSQAPKSMKSLISSVWLLTVAFGNVFVVIISEAKFFDRRVYEFLLYTVLMVLDMLIFVWMSLSYQYRKSEEDESRDEKHMNGHGQDNRMHVADN
nr:PREDICTED: peptide transporter family 1-like isoform X1 [Bemisia tabaci]